VQDFIRDRSQASLLAAAVAVEAQERAAVDATASLNAREA